VPLALILKFLFYWRYMAVFSSCCKTRWHNPNYYKIPTKLSRRDSGWKE